MGSNSGPIIGNSSSPTPPQRKALDRFSAHDMLANSVDYEVKQRWKKAARMLVQRLDWPRTFCPVPLLWTVRQAGQRRGGVHWVCWSWYVCVELMYWTLRPRQSCIVASCSEAYPSSLFWAVGGTLVKQKGLHNKWSTVALYRTKFPERASADGVLTTLVKGPWCLCGSVARCRGDISL